MVILTIILLLLVAYSSGVIAHWIATRKQRRLLKHYQRRERTLRRIIPME